MKSCRRGFIRCRSRELPCGDHQSAARALKCETSSCETVDGCGEAGELEGVGDGVEPCPGGAEEGEEGLGWRWEGDVLVKLR